MNPSRLGPSAIPSANAPGLPVLCIVGPTGSGKSRLAFQLAAELNGEIVNCDSLQVYRGFDIGTAKPGKTERAEIPHHLVDIADPAEEFTAGEFARLARKTILNISDRGKLPVVAGGTGFYLKALIDGLVEGPQRNNALRERLERLEARQSGRLHRLLARWDPDAAERIHAADVQKLIRALEVIISSNQSLTEIYTQPRDAAHELRVFQAGIDPPRQSLYARLDQRSRAMMENGLVDEVKNLLATGVPPDAKPFGAIGYKQALTVLQGNANLAEALAEMQRDTRRYAKRQWTWFRRDPRVHWVSGFGDDSCTHQKVVQFLYKQFFWY